MANNRYQLSNRMAALRLGNLGFTIMEVLVAGAAFLILAGIAYPVFKVMNGRAQKQATLGIMKSLGGAVSTYSNQNNGLLPAEDASGEDTWKNAAKPEAKEAWYNALPQLIGRKSVGDFLPDPRAFYTKENVLFVPGADYPSSDKKLLQPLFAIAFNTKLHRKEATGEKHRVKMSDVTNPARTVILLEQGLPGEQNTLEVQTKKDYDGSPKGSAKSFVGRYNGQGILAFLDGHAEAVPAKTLLTETGRFPFPQSDVVWTCTPEEDPNKNSSGQNVR